MQKITKILFSSFLTLLMVLGLAGCSQGNTESAETEETEETTETTETAEKADPESTVYEVFVTDEAGEPVEGVKVQFCSESECLIGTTDEDGIAAFEKEAGTYTVHIQKAPKGYAKDKTEYEAPEKPGRLTITLKEEDE